MRTTIEMEEGLHEQVRRRAQREGLSVSRMLGKLVGQALRQNEEATVPTQRSGRFEVIAPAAPRARATSSAVQKVMDEEGIL